MFFSHREPQDITEFHRRLQLLNKQNLIRPVFVTLTVKKSS